MIQRHAQARDQTVAAVTCHIGAVLVSERIETYLRPGQLSLRRDRPVAAQRKAVTGFQTGGYTDAAVVVDQLGSQSRRADAGVIPGYGGSAIHV